MSGAGEGGGVQQMMTIADKGYWKSRVGSLEANPIPIPTIPIHTSLESQG